MKISVVIPAYNEENYIQRCINSIHNQILPESLEVETIVVLNRCTDGTADIAQSYGATLIENNSKNLSAIRNQGISAASGEWVVTIDANSWMSKGVLKEIYRNALIPSCLGGGIRIKPERLSPGIAVGYAMMLVPAFFLGLSFGMYWFRKADWQAIGGFDEKRFIAEDVDFHQRLKAHGLKTGRKQKIIHNQTITTSCRKFDKFGDWHFVKIFGNPCRIRQAMKGKDQPYLDRNWYRVKR